MSVSADRLPYSKTLLSAVVATGWSTEVDVSQYRHVMVVVSSASSFNGTVKFGGSMLPQDSVAFTSAAAVGNEWDYVYAYNLQTAAGTAGDTGVVYTGTDAVEQFEINTDGMSTFAVQLSARAAGSVTVKLFAVKNS